MHQISPVESVQDAYGVDFRERSLAITAGMDFDQWDEFGTRLARLKVNSDWWLVDWLLYGWDRYGEMAPSARAFASAMESEGWQLSPKTAQNYLIIGREFPPEKRIADLTLHHYETVKTLEPHRQAALLEQAEREGMNVQELRRVARRFKNALPKPPTHPTSHLDRLEDTISENLTLYRALANLVAEVEDKTGLDALAMLDEESPEWPALAAAKGLIEDLPDYGED